jgi:hypothetical protein
MSPLGFPRLDAYLPLFACLEARTATTPGKGAQIILPKAHHMSEYDQARQNYPVKEQILNMS